MNMIYAERLRSALLERGWSQADLARRTTLDPGHISRYVNGKITPQRSNFKKILTALELTEREFMDGERIAPDESRLQLMLEVEVLLGLASRLNESFRKMAAEHSSPTLSHEHIVIEATMGAFDGKVKQIRELVKPASVLPPIPRARRSDAKPVEGQGSGPEAAPPA